MTYFKRWAFSINEGSVPNIYINFTARVFYLRLPFIYVVYNDGFNFGLVRKGVNNG